MSQREMGLTWLRKGIAPDAEFREGQWEAIAAALEVGAKTLVVQRTGWGKSLVYLIATRLLRDQGAGPTLLVSPLLSLMRNQVDMAERFGVRAVSLNSTNVSDWQEIEDELRADQVDLLLISPERLGAVGFRDHILPSIEARCRLLVIDEAHCISDWGHDFRPDYRRILKTVAQLPVDATVLATTATANDRVIEDIREQMGPSLVVSRGSLMRDSLSIRVLPIPDQAERLALLAKVIPKLPGSGIIYALTINDAKRLAEWLQSEGIDAYAYHGDLTNEERVALETSFQDNAIKALCATTALGMGYDKPDIRFVIHFQRPGSVISYYQQIGRAGRAVDEATVALLEGSEDDDISEYFIASAFPDASVFDRVLEIVKDQPRKLDGITARTNFSRGQVEKAVKLLDVEGVLLQSKDGFQLVDTGWTYDHLRSGEITAARRREVAQMVAFGESRMCRMRFLAEALDDPQPRDCGRCDRCCDRPYLPPSRELVLRAIQFLRHDVQTIEIKYMFPAGFEAEGRKKIPAEQCLEAGRALCTYGDAGWGPLVKNGKYVTGRFDDELVQASADIIRQMDTAPAWLCWVPSLHRDLLDDFALRIGQELGIPHAACVRKVKDTEPQKLMRNSTRQFLNIWESFEVDPSSILPGPCLLVDDIVDSDWTLTAVGVRLKRAGVAMVIPFALASSRPRSD